MAMKPLSRLSNYSVDYKATFYCQFVIICISIVCNKCVLSPIELIALSCIVYICLMLKFMFY